MLYRASNADCTACPLKAECCPKAPARKIPRSVHERAEDMARAIAETDACEASRKDRKKVEMLFAHLKRILKLGRLRLRGPCAPAMNSSSPPPPRTSENSPSSDPNSNQLQRWRNKKGEMSDHGNRGVANRANSGTKTTTSPHVGWCPLKNKRLNQQNRHRAESSVVAAYRLRAAQSRTFMSEPVTGRSFVPLSRLKSTHPPDHPSPRTA